MKYVMVGIVVVLVVFAYIMFAINQPIINEITETANASISAASFPETKSFVNWWPLLIWGIPGLAGVIAIVYYLKFWNRDQG